MNILVSGASFAGLSTAFWMRQLGHTVTVVEIASGLRTGGTAVDIRGNTVDIVKRMGVYEAIEANRLRLKRMEFKDACGQTARSMDIEGGADDEFEIERDVLLRIVFEAMKRDVEVVFGDGIVGLTEVPDGVAVAFKHGARRTFDLVLGCDGLHSAVRRLWFGPEAEYLHFLEAYFSVTIGDKLLIEENTLQLFNAPGRAIMLNAYRHKTDIVFVFFAATELAYDYRDEAHQRRLIAEQFADAGWRSAELLAEIQRSSTFYFDELCQIRMPAWTKGRVALVGDAGYCASPAAGMGGSLAIDGAAALADAMRAHGDDFARAFRAYDDGFRPFIDQVQAEAVRTGVESLLPRTEEAIRARNAQTGNAF